MYTNTQMAVTNTDNQTEPKMFLISGSNLVFTAHISIPEQGPEWANRTDLNTRQE